MTNRPPGFAIGDEHPLVTLLRGDPLSTLWGAEDLQQLTRAADHHGVVIPLYRALVRGNLRAADATALAALGRRRRAGALQITASALDVSCWLSRSGVGHVIVKGPAVATAYDGADREFVDLDLLVAHTQMQEAIATIQEHGAQLLGGFPWPRPDGIAEVTLMLPNGTNVDLHSDLVVQPGDRSDFRLSTELLLSRSTTALILDHELPVLDPEDTLIHVALHAVLSGGDRLVWLADIDALVRRARIAWPLLVERSIEARAALAVCVMLSRAVSVLSTPVPPEALRALQRSGFLWSYLMRLFERRRPTAANYGRSLNGQILMRSTRHNTAASLRKLASLIWTDVIGRVVHDRQHPWRVRMRQQWL